MALGTDPIAGFARLTPQNTYLLVKNGSQAGREFALDKMYLLVGRNIPDDSEVDIDLSYCELDNTPMISRRHGVIQWVNQELQICDLNSRNGTSVNGQKLISNNPKQPSPLIKLELNSIILFGNIETEIIIK